MYGIDVFRPQPPREGQTNSHWWSNRRTPPSASPDRLRSDTRVLQRLPGDLEQQPLLRIHPGRLARGDAEELRIELIRLPGRQKPAVPTTDRARHRVIRRVEGIGVPTLRRHPHNAAGPVLQQLPVLRRECSPHRAADTPSRPPQSVRYRPSRRSPDAQLRSSIFRNASAMIARRSGDAAVIAQPSLSECRRSNSSSLRPSYPSTTSRQQKRPDESGSGRIERRRHIVTFSPGHPSEERGHAVVTRRLNPSRR